jgi:hypothetical protein
VSARAALLLTPSSGSNRTSLATKHGARGECAIERLPGRPQGAGQSARPHGGSRTRQAGPGPLIYPSANVRSSARVSTYSVHEAGPCRADALQKSALRCVSWSHCRVSIRPPARVCQHAGSSTPGGRTVLDPDASVFITRFAERVRDQGWEEARPARDRHRSFIHLRGPLGGVRHPRDGGRAPQPLRSAYGLPQPWTYRYAGQPAVPGGDDVRRVG